MSSGTTNRISLTKARIGKLQKEVLNRLQFVTEEMIVEMDDSTSLYINIETNDCNNYQQLKLLDVELIRNDKVFENISEYLQGWLQGQIDDLNHEKYTEYIDFEYQSDYETLGGRCCDLSYN